MKKKLIDVLLETDPDKIVHIGASSGFFFIGTVQDAINSIDDIPIKKRNSSKRIKEIRKYVENIEDKCNMIDCIEKDIKSFKKISDRKVIEIYNRIQNDGICIIVEGTESGDFWYIEEYQKAHKDKEDD